MARRSGHKDEPEAKRRQKEQDTGSLPIWLLHEKEFKLLLPKHKTISKLVFAFSNCLRVGRR